MAQSMVKPLQKDTNVLHVELHHHSELITQATGRAVGLLLTGMFMLCKNCILRKVKKSERSEMAVRHSKILGEWHFFISLPSNATVEGR